MAPLHCHVFDVGSESFRDTQPVEGEQTGEGVVAAAGETGLDQDHSKFVAIETDRVRFVGHFRPSHMHRRRIGNQCLFDAVPIETGNGGQSPGDSRSGFPVLLEPTGEQFDMGSAHFEQVEVMVGAPADPLTQIQCIGVESLAGISSQKAGDRHPDSERIKLPIDDLGNHNRI